MKRDFNRAEMPGGSAWNLLDIIPDELNAPLRGRGGWPYVGGAMSSVTSVKALVYAPFTAGAKVLGIGQNGELWDVLTPTDIGAANVPGGPPAYYRGKVIIPNNDGTTAVKSYDGTTLGSLAGSPPAGMFAGSFKDHALLARSSANANRIWYSAAGDPTTWNTSSGYTDASGGDITAIAPLKSMILVFHADSTERIRGSIPPPGTDFIQEPFLSVGCLDAFSVQTWNDRVIFANAKGIFMTDGAGWSDLTARAGMSTYYQTQMASYTTSWRLGGGIYRNKYILSINNGATVVDTFVVNLNTGSFLRFGNFHANAFLSVATGGAEECYMALANAGRVGKISPVWAPVSATKNDADGVAPTPVWETPSHQGWDRLHRRWIASSGSQRWKMIYTRYRLTDYAADVPALTISYVTSPEATAYTAISSTLPANTAATRLRRVISTGNKANSIAFKVAQANAGDLSLFELALVYDPLEIGALL